MLSKNILSNTKNSLLYLSILTILLIFAQISFLIQHNYVYLGDFRFVSNHLHLPITIWPGIFFFLFAQLLIHFAFALMIWVIAGLAGNALRLSSSRIEALAIILWFMGLAIILISNNLFFPNSKFAFLTAYSPYLGVLKYLLGALVFSFLGFLFIALYELSLLMTRKIKILLGLLFFSSISLGAYSLQAPKDAANAAQPNIILIGIDSLRPDFINYFGFSLPTPHLNYFLKKATVFADAMTPLARTYPSWMSILTGEYPKLSGIRTNLENQQGLQFKETLSTILQQQGYRTIFATDETRFSNIDVRMGFNRVITPPIGFNDFLLGGLGDFPFSNLLVNTALGKYLFPHSFGNRAVLITYEPDSFLQLLSPVLREHRDKPTFLAVHLCLPHYPYLWAGLASEKISVNQYAAAIKRTDQQFATLMKMLQRNHFLEHSIIVLLSDHGEALELPGDRLTDPHLFVPKQQNKEAIIPHFYPPSADKEKVNQSGGHGTDVLGMTQYHTLLAFRTFGFSAPNKTEKIKGRVSLMDIKPTILQMLKLPMAASNSGHSLWDIIQGKTTRVPLYQNFFTESDFSPAAIRSVHPETKKILLEGINYFQINAHTQRLVVKDNMVKMIIASKQYANFSGSWVLALYPQTSRTMMPILVDLKTGQWTNDLRSRFAAESPAMGMLQALQKFYGSDLTTILNVPKCR